MCGHVRRPLCHAFRAESDRCPAPRQCAHGLLQRPGGTVERGAHGAADRGHRRRAQRRGAPRAAARGPALARARVGGRSRRRRRARPLPPERAGRALRPCDGRTRVAGTRVSVLLLARGTQAVAQGPAGRGPAAALRRNMRSAAGGRGRASRRGRRSTRATVPGAGRADRGVRRPDPRAAALRERRHRRLRYPPRGRQCGVLPRQRRG